jgi:hypothetical protein
MTVSELRERLKSMPDHAPVVCFYSKDDPQWREIESAYLIETKDGRKVVGLGS